MALCYLAAEYNRSGLQNLGKFNHLSMLSSIQDSTLSPKGNQTGIFIGMTEAEAEAPILRPLDAKS